MPDSSPLILVTGATGYIGGRLAPRLAERGFRVRCLVRDPDRLRGVPWEDAVEIVQGDVLKPDTLRAALEGVDAAYYLIHSMAAGDGFEERDREAARHFGEAARAAGVSRVLYLGGIEPPEGTTSSHLHSRLETGDVLREHGPPLTEFRAAVIVGSGSASFELIRHFVERIPVLITPKWVRTRTQPIAVRSVLCYLMDALTIPATADRVIEIGGPEVLTYADMFAGYAKVRGLKRLVLPVPVLTPKLSSLWAGLVTPVTTAVARPLIAGLGSEVVVTDPSGMDLFEVEPVSYEAAVRIALDRFRDDLVETAWHSALSSGPARPLEDLQAEAEGLIMDRRHRLVEAPPAQVFAEAKRIGGANGWLYANPLWKLRGLLDQLVGGPGLQRGRREQGNIREGEALDFWRVETIEPGRLLRLRAEMKLPGRAWLEFLVEPAEAVPNDLSQTRLTQTAYFEPKGLLGLAYWYSLVPIHPSIFKGMIGQLARRAEAAHSKTDATAGATELA